MSCHPNAMLILALTPDGLARKTYRAILEDAKIDSDGSFNIGGRVVQYWREKLPPARSHGR